MRYKKKSNVLHGLFEREYGVRCSLRASMWCYRKIFDGPCRTWKKVYQTKQRCTIDNSYNLLWLSRPTSPYLSESSVMERICYDGQVRVLYKLPTPSTITDFMTYKVRHTVYDKHILQDEYRPSAFLLRKGNTLTRIDLEKGITYATIELGIVKMKYISWNYLSDQLVLKSANLRQQSREPYVFCYKIFSLCPFSPISCFFIDGKKFPAPKDRMRYGSLRATEIHEGLLLVMTKCDILIYNVEDIIKGFPIRKTDCSHDQLELSVDCPPLLFVTKTYNDIMAIGGNPWTFITASSPTVFSVRDFETQDLLDGGEVKYPFVNEYLENDDGLSYHVDDTNRCFHSSNSDIRILSIKDGEHQENHNKSLVEEFHYPSANKSLSYVNYSYDYWMQMKNDSDIKLAYDVDTDLDVFVILEANTDESSNGLILNKVTFFDNTTYKELDILKLGIKVDGCVETNSLGIWLDGDIINIVSRNKLSHTFITYHLDYNWSAKKHSSRKTTRILISDNGLYKQSIKDFLKDF